MTQRNHNILKGLILLVLMIFLNLCMSLVVNSFFDIIIKLADDGQRLNVYDITKAYYIKGARLVYWFTIIIPVVINIIFVYHMPNWLDSWIKSQGKLSIEKQIAFMQEIIDRKEYEPQTLKDIYEKGKKDTEEKLKKILISKQATNGKKGKNEL